MPVHRSVGLFVLVVLSSACGAGRAEGPEAGHPTESSAQTSETTTDSDGAARGPRVEKLARADVDRAVDGGLGVLLRNVQVDDWPVLREGRFHGFRLRALSPAWNVGLEPGDVVLRVNDLPIEHPEEADAALRSLKTAPSLRIAFEREGRLAVLELPIVDAPGAAPTSGTAPSTSGPTSGSTTSRPTSAPPTGAAPPAASSTTRRP